jgi:hypothetical protein
MILTSIPVWKRRIRDQRAAIFKQNWLVNENEIIKLITSDYYCKKRDLKEFVKFILDIERANRWETKHEFVERIWDKKVRYVDESQYEIALNYFSENLIKLFNKKK